MPVLTILFVLFFIGLAVAMWFWQISHSRDRLDAWAAENGFELLSRERRLMFRGSFTWTSGKGQEVFYVTLRDAAGRTRAAYVRVGGWLLGQLSDTIDVRWDS